MHLCRIFCLELANFYHIAQVNEQHASRPQHVGPSLGPALEVNSGLIILGDHNLKQWKQQNHFYQKLISPLPLF
jgi:hypothetical protein